MGSYKKDEGCIPILYISSCSGDEDKEAYEAMLRSGMEFEHYVGDYPIPMLFENLHICVGLTAIVGFIEEETRRSKVHELRGKYPELPSSEELSERKRQGYENE